jgi:hypothetical protein
VADIAWRTNWKQLSNGLPYACALLGTVLLLAAPLASAQNDPKPRYPDLQTLPPSDLYPDTIGFGSLTRHILRFTNTVVNAGAGPLELRGDPGTGQLVQRLYDDAGGFADRPLPGADFIFHAEHGHWHLNDFAQYDLWRIGEPKDTGAKRHVRPDRDRHQRHQHHERDGNRRHKHKHRHKSRHKSRPAAGWYPVQAGRSKVSFCVRDTNRVRNLDGAPAEPVYATCEQDIQGLSVGWGDTYRFEIADQWLEVGSQPLPDGRYVLRSIADPRNLLDEGGNESAGSNAAQTCFTVTQAQIQITGC